MTKKRSGEAQAAQHRKAGPMKHRLTPRGGSQKPEWDVEYELCDVNYGTPPLDVKCNCKKVDGSTCSGKLLFDGQNAAGAFLICDSCACCSFAYLKEA